MILSRVIIRLLFLAFLNIWGHFEGLNEVFRDRAPQWQPKAFIEPPK
jgi:hypothetical protein